VRRGAGIGVGLIGCGAVTASCHLPALRSLDSVRVVAIADVDPARIAQMARFGVPRSYAEAEALLADPEVELVGVCVPARFHAETILTALEHGKHVFVEKPLALSLDEADALVERAGRGVEKTAVGFNLRSHPLVQRAQAVVLGGPLGRIESIRTVYADAVSYRDGVPPWRRERSLGGGSLFEKGAHHFDLWRFFSGSEVEEVVALTRSEVADDDAAVVSGRLENGVLASTVFVDGTSAANELSLFGTKGRLELCLHRFDGLRTFSLAHVSGDVQSRLRSARVFAGGLSWAARERLRGGTFLSSYRAEWQDFADSILRDRRPRSTFEHGRAALEITLAALGSANAGGPVRLAEAPRSIA
jgi:predicted dehydrogenase